MSLSLSRLADCPFLVLQNISMVGSIPEEQKIIIHNILQNRQQMTKLISGLLETLNSHDRRGFVDSFLIRKQSEEVLHFLKIFFACSLMIPFTVNQH